MELGRIGVWTSYRAIGEENAAGAAALAEQLGFGTFWLGGSPRLPSVRPLLEGSERMIVGTSIVNIWAYDPAELAAEYAALERDFPGRLLVGVGVGHREATSEYVKPLAAMRAFLDGLDAAPEPIPADRRCIASLGPKSLEMSAARSLGTIPYFVPVEHTVATRAALGPGVLIAPELAVAVDSDPGRGLAKSREYASRYLGLKNYTNNLLRHGFHERDIADGGSDRLIHEVVPHGTAEQVTDIARAHLDAGADHVALQAVGETGVPREQWTALAAAMS